MSVLDNALRQIWTHGVKLIEEWRNASPGSNFPAQTIPFPDKYNFAAIIGSDYTTGAIVLEKGMAGSLTRIGAIDSSTAFWVAQRYITWNNSGLVFDPSYVKYANSSNQPSANSAYCKPALIYGIQVLGGVIQKIKTFLASLSRREVQVCL